ncbi:MAG TPA: tyrosine-type recombinase/integrase [Devosia sp.]|jgi:integrase|nr:tyrosine-type recombinase/integrase [Devosia sp.]
MSVRKRTWTSKGVEKSGWQADYIDSQGVRRRKMFDKKKEAEGYSVSAKTEVREGRHVADSASATVEEAGKLWVAARSRAGREQTTIDQYKQHLDLHITPFIGNVKLTGLTPPALRQFEDRLLDEGRSKAMVRKVLVSLGSLLTDAQERGLVARNVVRDMRGRRGSSDRRAEKRAKGRLKAGVDIPTPQEIKAIVGALQGRWRPILLTGIFTGLRASELRGLAWPDVDLARGVIHVRQRADRFRTIGKPKSEAGEREVPLPPIVANTLREWKVACPKSDLNLVFPNTSGGVVAHAQISREGYGKAQVRAGVVVTVGSEEGAEPVVAPKYTGLHSLRHFYASWCINRRADGGLELPAKVVQERLGHSSITMTMDTYGHLFPRGDDGAELAAAEAVLLG